MDAEYRWVTTEIDVEAALAADRGRAQEHTRRIQAATPTAPDALSQQAGGAHYKNFPIQPVVYCQSNGLGFIESNVVKYVSRHGAKGKAQDVRKAIHMLELLLQLTYPEDYADYQKHT